MSTSKIAIIALILFSYIGAHGFVFIKYGSKNIRKCLKNPIKNYQLFLGLAILVFSFIFYSVILRFGEVSVLYPITSLGYVWITLLSMKHFNEKINSWKLCGVFLIIISVILIGIGS